MEGLTSDPYLLFTFKNSKGEVVRQMKEKVSAGMNRLTWDHRANNFTPVDGRRGLSPDQLFGSESKGPLVSDGRYVVTMSLVENGKLSPLGNEVSLECKLLDNASIPNGDFSDNELVMKEAIVLSKRVRTANNGLSKAQKHLSILEKSIPDINGDTESIIKSLAALKMDADQIDVLLNGDGFLAGLQFETSPSVSDRINNVIYNLMDVTSAVPTMYKDQLKYAKAELPSLEGSIASLVQKVSNLLDEAERLGAPVMER